VLGPAVLRSEATILKALLEECFGPLPEETIERADTASQDEMLLWTKRASKAKSLQQVFTP
jgi:hypothetical protein